MRNMVGEAGCDDSTGCVTRLGGRVEEVERRRAFSHEHVRVRLHCLVP